MCKIWPYFTSLLKLWYFTACEGKVDGSIGWESHHGQIQGGSVGTDVVITITSASACDVTSFCFKPCATVDPSGCSV
jgi:hypothetical protein